MGPQGTFAGFASRLERDGRTGTGAGRADADGLARELRELFRGGPGAEASAGAVRERARRVLPGRRAGGRGGRGVVRAFGALGAVSGGRAGGVVASLREPAPDGSG